MCPFEGLINDLYKFYGVLKNGYEIEIEGGNGVCIRVQC